MTIPYGTDFTVTFHIGGDYRIESGNDNLSVYIMYLDVIFLSDTDPRDSCTMCAIPVYQQLDDNEPDPGYDEFYARFFSDTVVFEEYSGDIQISIVMKNQTEGIVWDGVVEVTIEPESSEPELAPNSNDDDDDDDDEDFMGVRPEFLIVGAILLMFLFFNKGRDV